MGPIMTLQAAKNRTLPIVHLKLVSAKALQTRHVSTQPIRGRIHLQAAARRTLVPHDRCRGSNADRPVARRDVKWPTDSIVQAAYPLSISGVLLHHVVETDGFA
jgi:hypothetical protein